MVSPTKAAIRRLNDRVRQQVTDTGTIHAIDGDRVDLRIGTSPNVVRNVQVAGSVDSLSVGQTVAFTRVDGRPLVLAGGGGGGGGGSSSATYLTINQSDGTLPEHQHSGTGDGGLLNNYVIEVLHAAPGKHILGVNVPHDDHGNLTGLGDDDHPQYLNGARHNDALHGTINHHALAGLGDDDHAQYLNNVRHDTEERHTFINHHTLLGLGDDDHTQYLNSTRHDVNARHTMIDHHAFQGLADDDHTQYLNNARHDVDGRHTAINHHAFQGLADDDHTQYVHISGARTITAVHTFSPVTPGAPFTLNASAQGQTITGLRADELNKSILAGAGLSGGGAMTQDRTLALGTPSTVDAATVNAVTGTTHTHAVNASSDPGEAEALLKTDANGLVKLARLIVNNALTLAGTSVIGSGNFASGISGWQIQSDGDAEFNDITARGQFSSVTFASKEVAAMSGSLGVYRSSGNLYADVTPVASPATFYVDIDDPIEGHTGAQFDTNSILRLKTAGGDNWLSVTAVDTTQAGFYRYTCVLQHGTPATFYAGTAVVDYGPNGSGYLLMRADDSYSPFFSVATHAGSPWNGQTEHLRLGNLAGWGSSGLTGYGIGIGNTTAGESLYYTPGLGLNVQGTIKADDGYLKNLTVQGLLALETTGELRAGTATNGLRFGYLTDGYYFRGVGGGVTQVEVRASDGKLYAGGGAVTLDKDGMTLNVPDSQTYSLPATIKWKQGTANGHQITGRIWTGGGGTDSLEINSSSEARSHYLSVSMNGSGPDYANGYFMLRANYAQPSDAVLSAESITLNGNVTIDQGSYMPGSTHVPATFGGNLSIPHGDLAVGSFISLSSWSGQIGAKAIVLDNSGGETPIQITSAGYTITHLDADLLDGEHGSYYAGWRTSDNRPGVTRLYQSDGDSGDNVQMTYDGTRWLLAGYNAAGAYNAAVRVGYADNAGQLDGIDSTGFALASHTHSGIYVPFATPVKIWAPAANLAIQSKDISVVTDLGLASGSASALQVLVGGRWAAASASYYLNVLPYGTTDAYLSVSALVAATNLLTQGSVTVKSDKITATIAGSAMTMSYLWILGYYKS